VPGWRSAVAVAATLAFFAALIGIRQAQATFEIELSKAHFRVSHDETFVEPVVRYILEETEPGDGLLVYGHEAYYYFLSDRYSPWRFSQLYPGQAGRDGGAALVASLEREPPRIVVSGMLSWAGVPPVPAYTPVLVEYLRSHYQLDPSLFRRFPPQGSAPPPVWMVSVLEPRVQP
jgi:hypothetical protein